MEIYAHRKKNPKNNEYIYESLDAHEELTVTYGKEISKREVVERLGYSYEEFLRGIRFHDRGKINYNFQNKLKGMKYTREDSYHSLFSSILYLENFSLETDGKKKRQMFLNAYVIYRHHSKIVSLNDFDLCLEDIKRFEIFLSTNLTITKGGFERLKNWMITKGNIDINDFFYIRYFYSVLGSADIFATQEFITGFKFQSCESFKNISHKINDNSIIKNIKNGILGEGINELRSKISLEALKNYRGGISLLEAPTGAGKTITAYLLGEKANKSKLFYIAPFNNISNQTSEELLNLFSSSDVGLMNSNTSIEYKNHDEKDTTAIEAYNDYYYLNSPIIVTSGVKFFDILYSNRKKDILNFYSLVDSCVIIDEIQAFNLNLWKSFSLDIEFLSKVFNIDFIIMSATLPNLDIFANTFHRLIENRDLYFKSSFFKDRVTFEKISIDSLEDLEEKVLEAYKNYPKVLVEFINKKVAKEFYERISSRVSDVFLLTGDTKNKERKEILKITENKDKFWKGILIGTQVIEAGINIDFSVGFKDSSILESEEQFAGRINRNDKFKNAKVFLFNYFDEKNIYRNDVRVTPELTVNNPEIFQFLVEKDFNSYYYKILNYLNTKPEFKEFYKFLEKYEFMKLIANDSENIFILSEENREILDEYEKIYKDFDMEFYKKQILLKNLRVKIYEDSITIYPGDKRMEKVQEKAKIKYLEG
ncbi:MAG: CRISPR-associated helicase Cas3' [Cetobacterium sp.]|uniref:CRISPR-associated helicase Cas3' n=1 Tax=Cetobacterium sp. TaxID=2071632 RepID=UPI003F2F032A